MIKVLILTNPLPTDEGGGHHLKKTARSGGAPVVHHKIQDPPVRGHLDHLTVLAADSMMADVPGTRYTPPRTWQEISVTVLFTKGGDTRPYPVPTE